MPEASPGNSFLSSVYRDSYFLLGYAASSTLVITAGTVVAADATGAPDTTLMATDGTMRLGAGDGVLMDILTKGTLTTPWFTVSLFFPFLAADGTIGGYIEKYVTDLPTATMITVGARTVGSVLVNIADRNGLTPTVPVSSTALWAKDIAPTVNGVAISTSLVLNNCDIVKITNDFPASFRMKPVEGASHFRVYLNNSGGSTPQMWALARRLKGDAMRT